ncbi:spore coat polysaccharide biosynthesis protein [Paramagnetospirillum caucaseum]|uniref:Spore coat polysaccharide biosynthesis protein n=1 Tax=Paramagnetospirillum caucaseum TaxID=1244869 RepID=M2ZSH9_9PROT|nr:UDP-2,4-diacetamido-2,4,6-trideoxy-beta-L-altropyranose hydrolase [Paramagnetospirillum caucaseum]EME70302.1 spore coat polysaccharide biosynthesis protein [Paramagnetospirillum caucaseum]
MVTLTICFRADASAAIGTGHVMRCLTLAGELARRGAQCLFAAAPGTEELVPALPYPVVPPERLPFGAALAVVDHYGIGAAEEARIRGMSRAVMVIDDLPTRRHHCDLLLDQTHGRRAGEYRDLVPHGGIVLAGADYALLRPQFAEARPASLARRDGSLRRILVSLGGTDPDNVTLRVLDAIAASGLEVAVDVVMGAKAPHLETVLARAAAMAGARVLVGTGDMAGLMAGADLAIGAGGTTTWERCCLGLPTLMLVIADNQKDVVRLVSGAGAALEATPATIAGQLRHLAARPPILLSLSKAAAGLCDGLGAARTADALRRLPSLKGLSP